MGCRKNDDGARGARGRGSRHRKTRRVYEKALSYEKLWSAWKTVSMTCKNKRGVLEFAMFAHARVAIILNELKKRDYWPNRYRCFMIFEPKPRLVMSQSIRDKVVNHFVAREYLIPLLEPSLIDTNVATRKKRGAQYVQKMMRRYFSQLTAANPGAKIYALKIDISKYFYTIDHEILFEMLEKKIKDRDVLRLLRRIVNETNEPYINEVVDYFNEKYKTDIPHYETGKGLSIGAMTSQFLAIFYMSEVDRYIKEELKCPYFIRYMDDFLFLSHSKEELRAVQAAVEKRLVALKLRVNPKTAIYNCSAGGVPFLGYRYFVDRRGRLHVKCLARTVRRVRRRLWNLAQRDYEKYAKAYAAYGGYFMHAYPVEEIDRYVVGLEDLGACEGV